MVARAIGWIKRLVKLEKSFVTIESDLREHAKKIFELNLSLNEHVRRLEHEYNTQFNAIQNDQVSIQKEHQRQMIQIGNRFNELQKQSPETHNKGSELNLSLDHIYRSFEEKHRGSKEDILSKCEKYFPLLKDRFSKDDLMIDLGCGRCEWLLFLRSKGFQNILGVDLNDAMADEGRKESVPVEIKNALDFLKDAKDASASVITSFHVAEHLDFMDLVTMLNEIYRVLKPGGLVLCETPNPENVMVGSCNFYMDPSHVKPIPPAFFGFLLNHIGFDKVDCLRVHPLAEYQYAGEEKTLQKISEKFSIGQDYAIYGFKKL